MLDKINILMKFIMKWISKEWTYFRRLYKCEKALTVLKQTLLHVLCLCNPIFTIPTKLLESWRERETYKIQTEVERINYTQQ